MIFIHFHEAVIRNLEFAILYIKLAILSHQNSRQMNIEKRLNMNRNTLPAGDLSKDSLNKYKKNKASSKVATKDFSGKGSSENQFQKYFLDATNVFFEDRDSLKQLNSKRNTLYIGVPIWVFLAVTYFLMGRIKPFTGQCPPNATCKVFVRCNPGYEWAQQQRQCHIEKSIIDRIESVCQFQVDKLRLEYGDSECLEEKPYEIPFKAIYELNDQMTRDQSASLSAEIRTKITNYLTNQTNQEAYEFSVQKQRIVPLSKRYSFNCALKLYTQTPNFKFVVLFMLGALVVSILIASQISKQIKAQNVYDYLRGKVLQENSINVTLLNDEMKPLFGKLNQQLWTRVDSLRKKEGLIGFYQDDFLYWQLM